MGDDYYSYYQPAGKQGRQSDATQQVQQDQSMRQQYQAPYPDQQQHTHRQQGYQQPYYPPAPPQMPMFAANPTAQLGLHFGAQAFSAGHDYLNKNVTCLYFCQINTSATFLFLKQYFDVTNAFVLRKIALLLFPFGHKVTWLYHYIQSWQRGIVQGPDGKAAFKSPRYDINAPDLYIPSMAFITYCLLVGVSTGLKGRYLFDLAPLSFRPELLGLTSTSALIFIAIELLVVKLACYILNIAHEVHVLDFLCIIGYNFVGINTSLLCSFFFGRTGKYASFVYISLCMAFFVVFTVH